MRHPLRYVLALVAVTACLALTRHTTTDALAPAVREIVVTRVIDGDTLVASDPSGATLGRVRLVGIDAPELDGQECWAQEARQMLARLLPTGSRAQLVPDPDQGATDRYGRLLGYLRTMEGDVGLQLLHAGVVRPQGTALPRSYLEAERHARAAGVGLWRACGVVARP